MEQVRGKMEAIIKEFERNFPNLIGEDDSVRLVRYAACLETLEDAGLLESSDELGRANGSLTLKLTGRGETFLAACTPPKSKDQHMG